MKNLFKIFLALWILVTLAACDALDLDEQAINPNSVTPENAEINLVLNNVLIEFGDFMNEVSDETMPYSRMMALDGGDAYFNADAPNSFDFMWNLAYAQIIPDCNLVVELAAEGGRNRHSAVAKIIKAYTAFTMVDLFGDIPYSQAFQGTDELNPTADAGSAVYEAGLALLNEAIAELANPTGSIDNDFFYGGDETSWTKVANSLILRYYVNTRLVNSDATAQINTLIAGDLISEAGDDFQYNYGISRVNPDARSPYYADGYEAGGAGLYLSNNFMWLLFGDKFNEDPRLRYYFYRQDCDETDEDFFTLSCQALAYPAHFPPGLPWCTASSEWGDPAGAYGGYWGRDHGDNDGIPPDGLKRTVFGLYPAGGKFDTGDCASTSNGGTDGALGGGIHPILLSSSVKFYRAEAALTLGTSDDAATMLEEGIRESISKVINFAGGATDPTMAPDQTAIDDYVTEVINSFNSAGNQDDQLNIIMKEHHIALWGNGLDAYNNFRRTCMPRGLQPLRLPDQGQFSRSFWYPSSYVNRNSNANQKSDLSVNVFWDTNGNGCAQ